MRVVDDDEYQKLLATGLWFRHPNEAKKLLEETKDGLRKQEGLHPKKRQRRKHVDETPSDGREATLSV